MFTRNQVGGCVVFLAAILVATVGQTCSSDKDCASFHRILFNGTGIKFACCHAVHPRRCMYYVDCILRLNRISQRRTPPWTPRAYISSSTNKPTYRLSNNYHSRQMFAWTTQTSIRSTIHTLRYNQTRERTNDKRKNYTTFAVAFIGTAVILLAIILVILIIACHCYGVPRKGFRRQSAQRFRSQSEDVEIASHDNRGCTIPGQVLPSYEDVSSSPPQYEDVYIPPPPEYEDIFIPPPPEYDQDIVILPFQVYVLNEGNTSGTTHISRGNTIPDQQIPSLEDTVVASSPSQYNIEVSQENPLSSPEVENSHPLSSTKCRIIDNNGNVIPSNHDNRTLSISPDQQLPTYASCEDTDIVSLRYKPELSSAQEICQIPLPLPEPDHEDTDQLSTSAEYEDTVNEDNVLSVVIPNNQDKRRIPPLSSPKDEDTYPSICAHCGDAVNGDKHLITCNQTNRGLSTILHQELPADMCFEDTGASCSSAQYQAEASPTEENKPVPLPSFEHEETDSLSSTVHGDIIVESNVSMVKVLALTEKSKFKWYSISSV